MNKYKKQEEENIYSKSLISFIYMKMFYSLFLSVYFNNKAFNKRKKELFNTPNNTVNTNLSY